MMIWTTKSQCGVRPVSGHDTDDGTEGSIGTEAGSNSLRLTTIGHEPGKWWRRMAVKRDDDVVSKDEIQCGVATHCAGVPFSC